MKFIFTTLFSFVSIFLSAQIVTQYFDGADTLYYESIIIEIDSNSNWQIGPPQKDLFQQAFSPNNVIVTDTIDPYINNDSSSFTATILNLWGSSGILALQWVQMLDLEQSNDWGFVEFSIDNGNTWENSFDNPYVYNYYGFDTSNVETHPIYGKGFTGRDTTWKNVWLCYDLSWLPNDIMLKFTMISDSSNSHDYDGWMIDNMLGNFTWVHTVKELSPNEYMRISPNPTSGRVDIVTQKKDEYHIIEKLMLFNDHGMLVKSWENVPTKFFIDLSDQPDGNYILKAKTNFKSEEFRIILKNE